jgi:hypothetical protein
MRALNPCCPDTSGWQAMSERSRMHTSPASRWGEDLKLFDLKREYPVLYKHLQKLEADQAVIFAHAIEEEKPATSSGGFLGHVTLEELQPRLAA